MHTHVCGSYSRSRCAALKTSWLPGLLGLLTPVHRDGGADSGPDVTPSPPLSFQLPHVHIYIYICLYFKERGHARLNTSLPTRPFAGSFAPHPRCLADGCRSPKTPRALLLSEFMLYSFLSFSPFLSFFLSPGLQPHGAVCFLSPHQ